jgi:nitroimidazol reductase NimA-like FMN-containing flavoprotein (pyridoxamine 5'-phosphate oxidase superfamily)
MSPKRRKGRVLRAVSAPISADVAFRISTAASGKARLVNWSPSSETVSPDQSLRKSLWRQRLREPFTDAEGDQSVFESCSLHASKPYLRSFKGATPALVVYKRANRRYVAMTEDEVWDFLESQKKLFLAFTKPDGYPHVAPIWYVTLDRKIYVKTEDYKTKALLADSGKACLVMDDGYAYRELRGVIVWGRSRLISSEGDLTQRLDRMRNKRYAGMHWSPDEMPREWVEERRREKGVYIEIVPEKISSWDNRKV